MRLDKFVESGDLDPDELGEAVYFELADGAAPDALAQFLTLKIELPAAEAESLVGTTNARLQETMLHVARRLELGDQPVEIADDLLNQRWPADLARAFVARVRGELEKLAHSPQGREQLLGQTRRRMLYGLLWLAGGVFATWITHVAAERGAASYELFAYGPILFGIGMFGHSAFQWLRYKRVRVTADP